MKYVIYLKYDDVNYFALQKFDDEEDAQLQLCFFLENRPKGYSFEEMKNNFFIASFENEESVLDFVSKQQLECAMDEAGIESTWKTIERATL